MSGYSIVLFMHIVGALGIFVALGLEWTGLMQIRRAMTLEQVRAWMGLFKNVRKFGFVSMLTAVVTGIYMMVTVWRGVAWLYVSLGSLVLLIAIAQVVTAPRMAAIGQALVSENRPVTQNFHTLASNPLLWISLQTRVAIALGIIFLKVTKPDLGGSLLTLGVAIVLGLVSSLPMPRRERAQERPAD